MHAARLHWLPFDQPACSSIAAAILQQATHAPDLTDHTLIIAETRLALPLRRALIIAAEQQGHSALLGPTIVTLDKWLSGLLPADQRVCDEQTRLLILVEALLAHPKLLRDANPWTLAENLLQLFDELTRNNIAPAANRDHFIQMLAQGYQLARHDLAALTHEATLIHTLWQAWHAQLAAQQLLDPGAARVLALSSSLQSLGQQPLHLIGITPLYRAEQRWLQQLTQHTNVTLWLQGEQFDAEQPSLIDQAIIAQIQPLHLTLPPATPCNDYTQLLQTIFHPARAPLLQRSAHCGNAIAPDSLTSRLTTFAAHDAEHEAHAVELQVRRWIIAGKQRIAIVTENRRLARRIRALLERADIVLQDSAGWALSTTRAAAAVEALLECIEEDFAHIPLLDLFKSSFIFSNETAAEIKNAAYRLERDIIRHENIARGLQRYRDFIEDRQERLAQLWTEPASQLLALLQRLDTTTTTLRRLTLGKHAARDYLQELRNCLTQLQMTTALQQDAAGSRLLQTLEQMQAAAQGSSLQMHWLDFRAWLGRTLETVYFRPTASGSPVQLLNLAQAQLQDFDAVILAGAEQEQLPGNVFSSPFFNSSVRHELGLPAREQLTQQMLLQFYSVLYSAPHILITWRLENNGESVSKTPWVEAIETFITLAYQRSLRDEELARLLRQDSSQVFRCDTHNLPAQQLPPAPQVNASLLPQIASYSDLQKLVDCPYHFYAARCLQLTPPEEVQQVLSKREYGQRVHQCLQAFHGKVAGLPGPFRGSLSTATRDAACTLLELISAEVFARDLADNFAHRGWYHQWRACIPAYIDWQMAREQRWQCKQLEYRDTVQFTPTLQLKGQLDRLDSGADGLAVIDYKTGVAPSKKDVQAGEAIQLPFYALLLQHSDQQPVAQAEYLEISEDMHSKVVLHQESLQALSQGLAEQIRTTFAALAQQQPLPAWPHHKTCEYCPMETLCRKQMWENDTA